MNDDLLVTMKMADRLRPSQGVNPSFVSLDSDLTLGGNQSVVLSMDFMSSRDSGSLLYCPEFSSNLMFENLLTEEVGYFLMKSKLARGESWKTLLVMDHVEKGSENSECHPRDLVCRIEKLVGNGSSSIAMKHRLPQRVEKSTVVIKKVVSVE
ncbi:hypothetical protein Tco_1458793 [Tanacetum coccineum]